MHLFLFLLLAAAAWARDTKMLAVVNRHGARHSYVELERPEDVGALTANGHRMAYLLGKYLREAYPNLFPQRFSSDQNFIYASTLLRCRKTALAVMLGIYDFGSYPDEYRQKAKFTDPEWEGYQAIVDFKTVLPGGYQPIPVHSFLDAENIMFEPDREVTCPKIHARHMVEDAKEVEPILKVVNEFLPKMRNPVFDYRKLVNKDRMEKLADFVFPDFYHSQRYLGNDLGLSDADYLRLERIDTLVMKYFFFRFPEVNKYIFTEMGRVIIERLEQFQHDFEADPETKRFVLFSGHDVNVYAVLLAAGLAKFDCLDDKGKCTLNPRYASHIAFEVYQEDKGLFVETKYNGERIAICVADGDANCSLEQFISRLRDITYPDEISALRDRFCRDPVKPESNRSLFWLVIFALAVAIACFVLGGWQLAKGGRQTEVTQPLATV